METGQTSDPNPGGLGTIPEVEDEVLADLILNILRLAPTTYTDYMGSEWFYLVHRLAAKGTKPNINRRSQMGKILAKSKIWPQLKNYVTLMTWEEALQDRLRRPK